jgi:hypothetical protein
VLELSASHREGANSMSQHTPLYWNRQGAVNCERHIPYKGSDTWRNEGWRKVPEGTILPCEICAGIAQFYEPESLIGRKVVVVVNLAPRKLRGVESNGMIVAASLEGGKPVLAAFLEDVPVGARLK